MRQASTYRLTPQLVAKHGLGRIMAFGSGMFGGSYKLHASRPVAFERWTRSGLRGDLTLPLSIAPAPAEPSIRVVEISGAIEQRAGFYDECGGWSDGHDAITERMRFALAESDVLLSIDSPGGAWAGGQESIRRILEAKAQHGRRITAFANEMIGSMAYAYAACVADVIYGPSSCLVGSIGMRAEHHSIAGALAKDGVEVTIFEAPAGKAAMDPSKPLDDLGRARGQRDVDLACADFVNMVSSARGMSADEILALKADALTGEFAVKARLIDAVCSLEEAALELLALAESEAA